MKVAITKITVEIGKRKIELTVDEAQQLRLELDTLMTEKTTFIPIPYQPYVPPYQPYISPRIWYGWNNATAGCTSIDNNVQSSFTTL